MNKINHNIMQAIPAPFDLYLEERRQAILDVIIRDGRAAVAELAEQFGVSAVTIRGDLDALAGRNLIVRTHGGAVPAQEGLGELTLALRRQQQVKEKSRIGAAAAECIADGDAIYLDASSTSLAIAHHLGARRHITVLSNSLAVAQELLDAPEATLVLIGGVLQKETASCIGVYGLELLDHFNLAIGFFGAHGLTVQNGLTDVHPAVAEFKRPLIRRSGRVVAVLDGSKWGRVGVASFAHMEEIDAVITDASAPAQLVAEVRAFGVAVTIA